MERYILPICATIVFGIIMLNPFKFDWQQRLSLLVAISAFAYFVAHTISSPKKLVAPASDERISFLEHQVESLQAQQNQLADRQTEETKKREQRHEIRAQLALFLKEGKNIQEGIHYNNPNSLREKDAWEHRVEEYLTKNLDKSYAIRFRSPSHQVFSYPSGMNMKMLGPWGDIGAKMAMLNDFMSELKD